MTTSPYCGFENIEALRADTERLFADAIVIPNEMLPADMRQTKEWEMGTVGGEDEATYEDKKVFGRTASELQNIVAERNKVKNVKSEAAQDKEQKALRVRHYASMVENDERIQFVTDEERLYAKQMRFANLIGLITHEDIENARLED
jgi:hypothetical protein